MTVDELERLEGKIDKLAIAMDAIGRSCMACQLQVAINTRRIGEDGDISKDLECHAQNIHDLNKWQWVMMGGLAVLTFLIPISVGVYAIVSKVK